MGLGLPAPAGPVDPAERRPDVVPVRGAGCVVAGHVGDAAVNAGVDPDEVLAIGAGEALGLQLAARVGEAVVAGRRQRRPGDDWRAGAIGDDRIRRTPPVSAALSWTILSVTAAYCCSEPTIESNRSATSDDRA
jgi:hypothetical protein